MQASMIIAGYKRTQKELQSSSWRFDVRIRKNNVQKLRTYMNINFISEKIRKHIVTAWSQKFLSSDLWIEMFLYKRVLLSRGPLTCTGVVDSKRVKDGNWIRTRGHLLKIRIGV
ncbi:hypothetical protein QVD17_11461 [Tagetes erecta]|uniref:Uncharacterized protein n=1 Tax=Tagetes erecta TaxID=13708 RepID=A0AAD8NUZ0_TARER|nr:hypothetical protein QVD17_11461 [Tagetes erecta]